MKNKSDLIGDKNKIELVKDNLIRSLKQTFLK